jgi:hypothetical protein
METLFCRNIRTVLFASFGLFLFNSETNLRAQQRAYQTRQSACRHEPPPGKPLSARTIDSGIKTHGYVAERVLTQSASAAGLNGGEILLCAEYGRVEVSDSDDDQVRLQVRWDAFGEGAAQPAEEAKRVLDITGLRIHMTRHEGRLMVRVWHPMLGFTVPGGQPVWVSIRVQVPPRGAYRIDTEAFHGIVNIRRLTLSGGTLRGRVGEKLKGIDGFISGTELYDVNLAGNVEISNPMSELAAPITARLRITSNSSLTANTGGNINIAIQPDPNLGVKAWAGSQKSTVGVRIDKGMKRDQVIGTFKTQELVEDPAYETKPVRVDVRATSGHGVVNVASWPNAPLQRSTAP